MIKLIIFNDFNEDFKKTKKILQRNEKIQKILDSTGDSIKLADPHERLDNIIEKLAKSSDNDFDDLEKIFKSRVEQIEFKLTESTRQIKTNLFEIGKNSEESFTSLYNVIDKTNERFMDNVNKIEGKINKPEVKSFEQKKSEKKGKLKI